VKWHLDQIKSTEADALLREADDAIRQNLQAHAAAIVSHYGELGYAPRPVFDLMLRYAVSEDGALHAEKFYRTVSEEFAETRAAYRWRHLIALGQSPAEIVSLTLTELGCLPLDDAGEALIQRYLERRAVVGPASGGEPAFVDANGARLKADGLAAYLSNLRRVGINAEFNGALCRGLLAARFDLDTPFVPKSRTMPASPGT